MLLGQAACGRASKPPVPEPASSVLAATIDLTSRLDVINPFITIAGQTAPGGIQIRGKNTSQTMMAINAQNMVMRYMTLRKGFNPGCPGDSECAAGIVAYPPSNNVVLDHISFSWNQDESFGIGAGAVSPVRNYTYSYIINAEALRQHSTGFSGGGNSAASSAGITDIDYHHNLTITNTHRNPLFRGKSTRIVNNLWYNIFLWGAQLSGGVNGDIIGNKWKRGPINPTASWSEIGACDNCQDTLDAPGVPSVYVSGNIGWHQSDPLGDQYLMVNQTQGENGPGIGPLPTAWRRSTPMANTAHPITADPVGNIEGIILPIVGNSRGLDCQGNWVMRRDTHDVKLINQYNTNTAPNDRYDTEVEYGGFPTYTGGTPCPDADHDGMPDVWETSKGLNPNNASDRNGIQPNGFTNLEMYLAGDSTEFTPVPSPPDVSITAPANGATVAGSSVTVSATASDDVAVLGVQFKLDGANLGAEDTTSPYSVTWNTTGASEGSHTLTAVARDAVPNSTTSSPVTVTVDNVVTPSGGPISHWRFDETSGTTATDFITATGNNLTLSGGASFSAGGQFGNALSLNGTTAHAFDDSTASLNSTSTLTIAGWLKPTSLPSGFSTILTKVDAGSPTRGYAFNISNGKLGFVKGSLGIASLSATVSVGSWQHVAVTWDVLTGNVKFYTGGILRQTINSPGAIPAPLNSDRLSVGRFNLSSSWFNGLIDDLRVYNSTLSDAEILALAAVNAPPTVSLTAPANGSTVSGPVTVSATATDAAGVAGVQFKLDGSNLGAEDTTSPYSIVWNSALSTDGPHQLGAVARDTGGLTGTATTRTVTVNNADICP